MSDCVKSMEVVTYGGDRFTVGVDEEDDLDAHHRRGRAQGRDLREAARPPRALRRRDPREHEAGQRAAATGLGLQPRRAAARARLQRRPGARRHREHLRDDHRGRADPDARHVHADAGDRRVRRSAPGGRRRRRDHRALQADRPRGARQGADLGRAGAGHARGRDRGAARGGPRRRLAARAVRRRHRPRSPSAPRRTSTTGSPSKKGYDPERISIVRSQQEGGDSGKIWALREGGLGATAFPPDGAGPLAGMGGLRGPAGEGRAVPGGPPQALRQVRDKRVDVRPLRAGLHPLPDLLRPPPSRRAARVPRVHGRGGRPLHLLRRLALGRARRRPAARRVPREAVRARAGAGVPRVQGDLGPRPRHEPRQGRRPVSDRRQPQARGPTTTRRGRRSSSPTARTAATSRTRRCAASASASAASRTPSR